MENEALKNVLFKNINLPKNQLHEQAKLVKAEFVNVLEGLKSSSSSKKLAYKLLTNLFGPNSFTNLSSKKHHDMISPICKLLDESQITEYLDRFLTGLLTDPNIGEFYPEVEDKDAVKLASIR